MISLWLGVTAVIAVLSVVWCFSVAITMDYGLDEEEIYALRGGSVVFLLSWLWPVVLPFALVYGVYRFISVVWLDGRTLNLWSRNARSH